MHLLLVDMVEGYRQIDFQRWRPSVVNRTYHGLSFYTFSG